MCECMSVVLVFEYSSFVFCEWGTSNLLSVEKNDYNCVNSMCIYENERSEIYWLFLLLFLFLLSDFFLSIF